MLKIGNVSLGEVPRAAVIVTDATTDDQLRKLSSAGIDFLELRIDKFRDTDVVSIKGAIARFKAHHFPLIVTIRIPEEGGEKSIDNSERESIYTAILPDVDALDVELRCVDLINALSDRVRSCGKVLIGSHHNFSETPDEAALTKVIQDGKELGVDIVKIAVAARSKDDVMRLLRVTIDNADKGLITIAMGLEGTLSRVLFPFVGSLITYGFIDESAAPGQINIFDLKKLLMNMEEHGLTRTDTDKWTVHYVHPVRRLSNN